MNVTAELNFTSLAQSINNLISSSQSLDHQKATALRKLHSILPKPPHAQSKIQRFFHKMLVRLHLRSCKGSSSLPPKEIKKVLEEIRGINKKLQGFESGFISEEGLKVSPSCVGQRGVVD
jgi:N-acetylated-alpha-linked acidic dipeptidase